MFELHAGPTVKQFAIVIVASFPFFHLALGLAWLSPTLVQVSKTNQTVLAEPMSTNEGSWLVSISVFAGLFVMPFAGYFANRLGRKRTIVLFCIPRILTCIILIFADRTWMLLLARSLTGTSDLVLVSVAVTYSSEIASKEIRGALGTVSQILSSLGGLILLTIGPYVSFDSLNIIYICLILGTIMPMFFIPETPYFLHTQGRKDESIRVLTSLRGSEILAREEIIEYSTMEQIKIDVSEFWTDRVLFKTTIKVIILSIFSMLSGYSSVAYYLQTVFDSTHVDITSEISSLIIGCIQMAACFCTILLTDRLGRKPILAISMTGMTIGMAGLGTFFKLAENGNQITGFVNYLPLISIALAMFCFNAGLGSIQWMMVAEIFEGRFRAVGVTIGIFTASLFVFLSTRYFPDLVQVLGPSTTYYIFSGCCIFTGVFIAYYFNETRGKAFSQIQKEMGRDFDVGYERKSAVE